MSKFFTYEERLNLQKYLKESCSFKEIGRRLDKTNKANCISVTKVAFHFQNLLFGYKNCVSFTNIQLSVTKTVIRFTKWHLAFQLSFCFASKGSINKNLIKIDNNLLWDDKKCAKINSSINK